LVSKAKSSKKAGNGAYSSIGHQWPRTFNSPRWKALSVDHGIAPKIFGLGETVEHVVTSDQVSGGVSKYFHNSLPVVCHESLVYGFVYGHIGFLERSRKVLCHFTHFRFDSSHISIQHMPHVNSPRMLLNDAEESKQAVSKVVAFESLNTWQ
jgi:hypothetical protein